MNQELTKRILSSIILLPITFFLIIEGSFLFIIFIIICFFISVYEWNNISKKNKYNKIGYIFIFFSFLSIYNLRINIVDDSIFLLIVIICISTDIGGYIFGKVFRGPKLTIYSPNKTFAGMLGSFIFSILFMFIFIKYYDAPEPSIKIVLFILIISFISQLGDIIVSYFKRLANVKDTGNIIPGHGGLLDRIDGMLFVFPFSNIIISLNIL